ncbi:MAG: PA14 domain-containing protein, partial [Kiritimatiellaeota bacterium]|nr:PA14 domain-containing protein [Kiritimatiellota bacterium]
PPVTARYARYCGPDASYGNAAEIEFVLADQPPLPPNGLTVTASDITNMYAVLSWRLNDVGSLISSVLVHRATSPGGPYVCMTPEGLDTPQQEWTDTDLIPGVTYFYRLTSLWVPAAGPPLESEPGPHVSYLPYARLERDWIDNTQLKPGMTILGLHYTPYNGDYLIEFLFDGDTGTSPDTSGNSPNSSSNPAVGVDLGKPHCIQFMRFVARENQLGRLNGAELRGANDPDYTNNFTRLATFANSANFQFITIPTVTWEPFRYIFVQRPDEYVFNGNIAELELYGWDPDAFAGLFRAPPHVDLSIQTGGVQLDWEPDAAQDFYRIQRSADGISWTDVGTTDTPPFTDGSVTAGQHVFYRIVAVRGTPPNEETATSAVYPIIAYFLGGGTGLTATYFTNYFLAYDPAEAWAGTFTEGPLDWGNINTVRPEIPGSADNFRIVWTGKLIVPFESDYTFYATCDDGFALRIDDTFVLNRWYYTSATEQVTVHLTAGEHPLRLDYFQAGGGKGMKLEWGGPVERAVIPASQLLPDPLPPNEDVFTQTGDWLGRTFGGRRLGYHTLNPDGSITLGFADGDIFSTAEQYHYVWQTIRGDFIFEAKADMDIDPLRPLAKAVLMVRNDLSGGSPLIAFCHAPQNAQCIVDRLVPGAEIDFQIPWTGEPPGNPLHLRIKRVKDVFTCAYRAPGSAAWVEYPAFTDSGGVFERELYIGMAITSVLGNSPKMLQDVTFSEMKFTRLNGTMLMIR